MIALNLGCGTNSLPGWKNFDSDVDIAKPLPFDSDSADFIFAEHVVEHVGYYEALGFFRECHRVLKDGGVVRIAVPSLERVMTYGTPEYFKFAAKWAPTADRRGAMHAILNAHGHRAPWTDALLRASLYTAGFDGAITAHPPGQSAREELRNIEGHGRVIGEYFNWIETTVAEATKAGVADNG